MRFRLTRTRVVLLVSLVAVLAAGVAYSAIPDGNGVYTACKLNATGTVRLIDPGVSGVLGHCNASLETQISWNQKGQPGAAGATGPQGPPGTAGAAGAAGKDGINGTNGVAGKDGAPGKDGVSVTSQPEPAGANCAGGGAKFTDGGGQTTFACSAAPRQWQQSRAHVTNIGPGTTDTVVLTTPPTTGQKYLVTATVRVQNDNFSKAATVSCFVMSSQGDAFASGDATVPPGSMGPGDVSFATIAMTALRQVAAGTAHPPPFSRPTP